jgi:hypothetical protein
MVKKMQQPACIIKCTVLAVLIKTAHPVSSVNQQGFADYNVFLLSQ